MTILKYPIIPITIIAAIGIALGSNNSIQPITASAIMAVAFAALVMAYRFSLKELLPKPYFTISVGIAALVLGIWVASLHYAPNHNAHYTRMIDDSEKPTIKGYISERIKPNNFSEKYYLKVQAVNGQYATGKILVTASKKKFPELLNAGDIIVIYDSPQPITKAGNPYQFDYAAYMERQNIFHQIKLKSNHIKAGQLKNTDYYIECFRNDLISSFNQHNYSPKVMNVIKALLLGQRQDMDKDINQDYIDAGVIHILAISGLHIAILFYIINLILKPLTRFRKKGRLIQLLLILAFLWSFAIVAGLSASVVRAVVMFSFVSIGLYFNRNANTFNSIAVSMLVLLLAKPSFLFDVGFQLSYAAVFSIVWLQPLYRKIKISKYKVVNYFADVVVISLVAQLGVLPLTLYYFGQFPALFPIANIVAIPAVTVVLVMGIVVVIINYIYSNLALLVGKVLAFLIECMNGFIGWIASFKGLVIKDISFTLPLTASLYGIIIAAVLWGFQKKYKRTVALLCAIILFQSIYIVTKWQRTNSNEFVVFNNWANSLIAYKQSGITYFYSNDSIALENWNLKAYAKGNFADSVTVLPLQHTFWYKQKRILVVDSLKIYETGINPDIVVLRQSTGVNLQRLIETTKPKVIVADATNYQGSINRWKATCNKNKIPFHATAEKGSYILK
ncbi:ComEC/Rec2 family competence protein [Flavobacterium litorale]|uniref:Competence protein ComEC family protein n=1 Tax=Flavobacterium litorale TaxID=2856519 RepID=A0ABX8V9L4_9FLAO|nr:ComEC/Rec2 family competence protein [Flavobacterium litorale]QYJ69417.1 competence protein ComEC family protein [Flavobacterium litorale]